MIPTEQLDSFRQALEQSARPLIFFDDDPDGVCSFLQLYKLNPEARGVIYKAAGSLNTQFLKKVDSYHPDAILIVDVPKVDQEFLDGCSNVHWLDHHAPLERKNVTYYNAMLHDKKDERPISYWTYELAKQSLWIAMVGCVGDWFLPEDLAKDFRKEYEDLLPKEIKRPQDALFATKLGTLSRMFSFALKGHSKDAMTCVKVLTRINDPYEILNKSTPKGKFIWKKYNKINKQYMELKNGIPETKDNLITFFYEDDKMSLTSDLSNETLYENPDKFILIGREKNGEMKISMRSAKYEVLPILQKALEGVEGYGGGHVYACGGCINKRDLDRFVENIKEQL